jgi:hypothetical protein
MRIALDLDLTEMDDHISMISRSGASGTLIAEFRALADATATDGSPKYAPKPVMQGLARFITRSSGGPNKDSVLYEISHLVAILERLAPGSDARADFFLGTAKAAASVYRVNFEDYADIADAVGIVVGDAGVTAIYDDVEFTVRYGRIPLLAALYEFLIALDEFQHYQDINDVFDALGGEDIGMRDIQDAANKLSSIMRQYRRKHIQRTKYDEKFNLILSFLRDRSEESVIHIDDASILDFWVSNTDAGDFRVYKTVFEGFIEFMKAFDMGGRTDAVEHSAVIGTDFEGGEVEPDDESADIFTLGDWQSPLEVLSEGAAADIKFLKRESEQKPIEVMMQYGPYSDRLPVAFLRLESFGPIQAGITNDLQVKRGRSSIEKRLPCDDAPEYRQKISVYEDVLAHVKQLQKAAYHVLQSQFDLGEDQGDVVPLFGNMPETSFQAAKNNDSPEDVDAEAVAAIGAEAESAFRKIVRKGFEESVLQSEDRIEGFRIGAGALITIESQLLRFIKIANALDQGNPDLAQRFTSDREIFSTRFRTLYGENQ